MTLREQLQDALGSAYTIQRELGGGGMSRVFLARDQGLGRDVPDLPLHHAPFERWTLRARVHQRLGWLYEQKGDRARALSHYRAFIELWKDADPELQPRVTDARQRVAALTRGAT